MTNAVAFGPVQARVITYVFADARLEIRNKKSLPKYRAVLTLDGKFFEEWPDYTKSEKLSVYKTMRKILLDHTQIRDEDNNPTGLIAVVESYPPRDVLIETEKGFLKKLELPQDSDLIIALKAVIEREEKSYHPDAYQMLNDIERATRALRILGGPRRDWGMPPFPPFGFR